MVIFSMKIKKKLRKDLSRLQFKRINFIGRMVTGVVKPRGHISMVSRKCRENMLSKSQGLSSANYSVRAPHPKH